MEQSELLENLEVALIQLIRSNVPPAASNPDLSQKVYVSQFDGNISKAIESGCSEVVIDKPIILSGPINLRSKLRISGIGKPMIFTSSKDFPIFLGHDIDDVQIQGIETSGGECGFIGWNISNLSILDSRINSYSRRGIDVGENSPNLLIQRNQIRATTPKSTDAIFVQDVGEGLKIIDNFVETLDSTDHGIGVHTYKSEIDGPIISNNTINHSGPNFALEVGQFGSGSRVMYPIIEKNKIKLLSQSNGGISVSGSVAARLDYNNVNLNGFGPDIAGIETVNAQYTDLLFNRVWGGNKNSRALSHDTSSDLIATGNRFEGQVILNNSGTFPGLKDLCRNSFFHNSFMLPDGSDCPKVIIQTNTQNCNGIKNRFFFNQFLVQTDFLLKQDQGILELIFGQ